ncbi:MULTISPECIES: NAD-dependent epimerase/dehydratase family protein [unclassified Prochlorococcus]|uniref:NAD-dependent epimerase/dehydratase family protein n=1 Tax=unclassified Prochlorococcus TaxID=2627481 RepID=UPI0005336E89|nr:MULTISPECIES: NAD-dependent epimerase/dehydratase family protein [unclassified Prochlorococcus]KGG16330.1 UDP-glucose 4-epimerase [Prochlorococcus sp. MIT 0603]KGG17936.1 UDP-glucose 4-epimerase [Prochlorococcus sp. MIT 0602]
MAKIIVTGSNGFLGKSLCEYLSEIHEVIGVRRNAYKYHDGFKEISYSDLFNSTANDCQLNNCTHIIHAAGLAHKEYSNNIYHIFNMYRSNVTLTRKLAITTKRLGIKNFIFISTIAIHGDNTDHVDSINESSAIRANGPYARSKLLAEACLNRILDDKSSALTIVRPSLVYGKNAPGNIKKMVGIIDLGLPLPIMNFNNKRSFLSIGNFTSCIDSIIKSKKFGNYTYVLSDNESISPKEFIANICKVRNSKNSFFKLNYILMKIAQMIPFIGGAFKKLSVNFIIDNSYVKKSLDWCPPFTLAEAINNEFSEV